MVRNGWEWWGIVSNGGEWVENFGELVVNGGECWRKGGDDGE